MSIYSGNPKFRISPASRYPQVLQDRVHDKECKVDFFHPCGTDSRQRVFPPSFWFRGTFIACRGRLGVGHPAPACSPLLAVSRGETGDRSPRLGPPARRVIPEGDSSQLSHTWGLTAAAYTPAS